MNVKTSVFAICVGAIIDSLLYNLHGSTFNYIRTVQKKTLIKSLVVSDYIQTFL